MKRLTVLAILLCFCLLLEEGEGLFGRRRRRRRRRTAQPCDSGPCVRGSCTNTGGTYTCNCPTGWSGSTCNVDVNECSTSRCTHGSCTNTAGSYYCTCEQGWQGSACNTDIDECTHSNPCQHGRCHNTAGGYLCICGEGYYGLHCESACMENCARCSNGFMCNVCNEGYEMEEYLCIDANECIDTPYPCIHGTCSNEEGGYRCHCAQGYEGTWCETDTNECQSNPGICNHGECVNTPGGYECQCDVGWERAQCNRDINECSRYHPCVHGRCMNSEGSYSCMCAPGYQGRHCAYDVNECVVDNPCGAHGTCNNIEGSYVCVCHSGYQGVNCTEDKNECDTDPCIHGLCYNDIGTFHCTCEAGWEGERCDIDADECSGLPCIYGNCTNTPGDYQCVCDFGFTGRNCSSDCMPDCEACEDDFTCSDCSAGYYFDVEICKDVDECDDSPCNNGICENHANGYTCVCESGWTGTLCDTDIDDCGDGACLHGECIDGVGSYQCQCHTGYRGENCDVDVDECSTIAPCIHGTCIDVDGGYMCNCTATGYQGLNCSQDIVECDNHPCMYGECTNTIGSYSCQCDGGFTGHNCDVDIDECEGLKPCEHGTCRDYAGGYECECEPGWTGTDCDQDIKECDIDGLCNEGRCYDHPPGGYTCDCGGRYNGTHCEYDRNECLGSACENGECINLKGSYRCDCNTGYFGSRRCIPYPRARLYDHGYDHDPWAINMHGPDIWQYKCVRLREGEMFDINCRRFDRVCVSPHGYISLGGPDRGFANPQPLSHQRSRYIIAALHTLNQGSPWDPYDSNVWISKYSKFDGKQTTVDMFDRIQNEINQLDPSANLPRYFEPKFALIVTYNQMRTYPFREDKPKNTFQITLVSDTATGTSLAIIKYEELESRLEIPNTAGIQIPGSRNKTKLQRGAGTKNIFYLHILPGNPSNHARMDQAGEYFYLTNQPKECPVRHWVNPYLCLKSSHEFWKVTLAVWHRSPRCFCNRFSSLVRGRFVHRGACAYRNFYSQGKLYIKECCFRRAPRWPTFKRWWRFRDLLHSNTVYEAGGRNHLRDMRRFCCASSRDSCNLYKRIRDWTASRRYCRGMTCREIRWANGDPHIVTWDGTQYSFQGVGEYVYAQSELFSIQARMTEYQKADGEGVRASVISAVVMKATNSSTVQVEANGAGLIISSHPPHPTTPDLTQWFIEADDMDSLTYPGDLIMLIKLEQDLAVKFVEAETELSIQAGGFGDLSISLTTTEEEPGFSTVGLMGQINGDPSDDLTTPENVTLPANSTEETIYWGLGQKWLVNLNNTAASMFIYPAGMTSANFTTTPGYEPRFHLLASQTEERRAEIDLACGNSVACSYDLAATENEEFAEKRQVFEQLIANTWEMSNAVQPHILTLSQVNATVGEEVEFTVTVKGAGNDTFEFLTDLPDDAEFIVNDTVGTVIWTPQSRDPVYGLPFGGAGSNGYPAYMKTVSVLLCDCSGHGECDFDFIQNVEFDNDTFALAQCDCHRGYAGDFCEEETDACIDDPCVPGSQCTDMSAEEEQATGRAFTCTACPQGYQQLDGFCVEIDECEEAEAQHITLCNPSENSQCHNLIGSYECTCNSGYMMTAIPNTCADKNECQLHEHACTQLCINTEGSYRCGCAEHYVLQEDGKTCLIDENALTPCLENMLCSDYCADASQCGCRLGMSLIDQFTCTYDQECVLGTHGCGANSECIYNFPGYSCKCVAGFKLNDDSRTCTECKPGFWGIECEELCSCATAATLCLPDTGCVECPTGWTGGSCTEDINECNNNPTLCGEYGNCTNSLGTYRCECDHGYEWNVGETDCTYINYCLLLTEAGDEPCYNGGVCEHNIGGFTCACATGYEGERCEIETDECASSPCLNDAYCQDQVGSYTCICPQGFTGENCEEDIDECASNPCLNEGLCADRPGSYDCHCPYPWSEFRCIELDACHSNPCANSGTCIDLPGTYRCVCASGWEGDRCEIDINECALHTDECSQICTNTDGFYECSCRYRYELAEDLTSCIADDICVPNAVFCDEDQGYCIDGRSCGCNHGYSLMEDNACVDTDECAINTHRCDEHGDCINELGGYRCRCHEGYALQNNQRTCQMIDWCVEPTPVNKCLPEAQCVPEVGGFRCVCLPGLTGEYCEIDINNCESNPCYNGAYCEDGRRDSVFCSCRSGFYGEMCDGDYDECISNPCQNEGKCEDLHGGYTCLCIQGFTGANCENDLRECDYSPCVHGACIDMVGGYQCSCDQLYGGRHCEQEPCASNPCRRNGLCYIEGGENNEYRCECGALYDGDNCEIELDMESLPTTVKTMFTKVSGKFDEELKNRSSAKYREFTYMSKLALKTVLLQYFANDFVDVRNFEYDVGSINIVYDIILLHNTTITAEVIVDTMHYVVNKNGGVLPGMEEYPVLHIEKYDARESEFDIVAITVGLAVAALLAVCCIISARFLWKNKRNRLGSTTFINVDPVDGNDAKENHQLPDNRDTPLPSDARPESRGSVTHSISDINFE